MPITKLPGLIDVHVHLRETGAIHKEDFVTGSRAAIKGGFTYILDMPNNPQPTFTRERMEEKISLSKKGLCDIGFYAGTDGKNLSEFLWFANNPHVFGLKVYCNHTTGELLIEDKKSIEKIFKAWESKKLLLVHAEMEKLELALHMAKKYKRRLHLCHIARKEEVEMIRKAKQKGQDVTTGVTPHHLYLTNLHVNVMKGYAFMKPELGELPDQEALWEGLLDHTIDLVESDHAPHTKEEKEKNPPVSGVPGLETTLGLLGRAVMRKRIKLSDIKRLLYINPKRIFNVPSQPNTYIEVDFSKSYTVGSDGYETKCNWSPFDGWEVYGKVLKTVIRGNTVFRSK
ncbi:MAG: amidohydrolase family protein [Patescibacteria group bacterium]